MKTVLPCALLLCLAGASVCLRARADDAPAVAPTTAPELADKVTDDTIREFHSAVAAGDRRLVEKMLGTYPDLVSSLFPDEDPAKRVEPLFTAIDHQQPAILQLLLKHGASYVRGATGQTPLDRAVLFGNLETVKILLDAGANIDGLDDPANQTDLDNPAHGTPLRDAAVCGHPEIAHFLVHRGAHVDLYSAAGLGWTGFVTQQIAAFPEQTDLKDDWTYTPLCYAVAGGCASTAELLLQHGADITYTYSDDGTLLHLATVNGDHALIAVLLAHGVNVNAKNKAGETAVDYAIKYHQSDAEQLIREHGGKRASELNN